MVHTDTMSFHSSTQRLGKHNHIKQTRHRHPVNVLHKRIGTRPAKWQKVGERKVAGLENPQLAASPLVDILPSPATCPSQSPGQDHHRTGHQGPPRTPSPTCSHSPHELQTSRLKFPTCANKYSSELASRSGVASGTFFFSYPFFCFFGECRHTDCSLSLVPCQLVK